MEIEKKLNDLEKRVQRLEAMILNEKKDGARATTPRKQRTLSELARGKTFKNGQHKIVLIVGYLETIVSQTNITEQVIKSNWTSAKIPGGYQNGLLQRAIRDGLIRSLQDGCYDLSQSGEDLFGEMTSKI